MAEQQLKILCVGLPRTGTRSLAVALGMLGFKTKHEFGRRWSIGELHASEYPQEEAFRNTGDFEAVTEPMYWLRMAEVHTEVKIILTVRNQNAWYESVRKHYARIYGGGAGPTVEPIISAYGYAADMFGSPWPQRHLYIYRYLAHNLLVRLWCKGNKRQFLEFDVSQGWKPLCEFLGREAHEADFPWENKYAS